MPKPRVREQRTCPQCLVSYECWPSSPKLCCSVKCSIARAHRPWEERFWARVIKPEDPEACWDWQGARHQFGYGKLSVNRQPREAHRLSWELHYGPVPDNRAVLHRCDNPPCCNPRHLFLGTEADNRRDCVAKGRQVRGETHPRAGARLTESQVRDIRRREWAGETYTALAREYAVSVGTISLIIRRKSWRHVSEL